MKKQQDNPNPAKTETKEEKPLIAKLEKVRNIIGGCFSVAKLLEIDVHGNSAGNDLEEVERWEEDSSVNVLSDVARLLQRQLDEAWLLACEIEDEMGKGRK